MTPELRDEIMKLLYEEAPDSPWLPDVFWDKLLALVERERRKAVEEAFHMLRPFSKEHYQSCREHIVNDDFKRGFELGRIEMYNWSKVLHPILDTMFPPPPSP